MADEDIVGIIQVPLYAFKYRSDIGREEDEVIVKKLSRLFKRAACRPHEWDHHAKGFVDDDTYELILAALAVSRTDLRSTVQTRQYPRLRLRKAILCLDGRQRIAAARRLYGKGFWWTVKLYARRVESLTTETKRTPGEIYWNVRRHEKKNELDLAGWWRLQLSPSMQRLLALLLRVVPRVGMRNREIVESLDRVLLFPGMRKDFKLGNVHRDLALHCPKQLSRCLRRIGDDYHTASGDHPEYVCSRTVRRLQGLNPSNREDGALIVSLMKKRLIFPMAKERSSRKLILARLLTIRHILHSMETFNKNMMYFAIGAKILRKCLVGDEQTFPVDGSETLFDKLFRGWQQPREGWIETREDVFARLLDPDRHTISMELFLEAIKHFARLSSDAPYQDRRGEGMTAGLDNRWQLKLIDKAQRNGLAPQATVSTSNFVFSVPELDPDTEAAEWRYGKPSIRTYLDLELDAFLPTVRDVDARDEMAPVCVLADFMDAFFGSPAFMTDGNEESGAVRAPLLPPAPDPKLVRQIMPSSEEEKPEKQRQSSIDHTWFSGNNIGLASDVGSGGTALADPGSRILSRAIEAPQANTNRPPSPHILRGRAPSSQRPLTDGAKREPNSPRHHNYNSPLHMRSRSSLPGGGDWTKPSPRSPRYHDPNSPADTQAPRLSSDDAYASSRGRSRNADDRRLNPPLRHDGPDGQAGLLLPGPAYSLGRSLARSRERSRGRSRAPRHHSPSSPEAQDIPLPDRDGDGPEAQDRLPSPDRGSSLNRGRSRGISLARRRVASRDPRSRTRSRAPHHHSSSPDAQDIPLPDSPNNPTKQARLPSPAPARSVGRSLTRSRERSRGRSRAPRRHSSSSPVAQDMPLSDRPVGPEEQARLPSPAPAGSRGRSLARSRDARSRTRSRALHYHSPSSPDAQDIRMPDRDGPEAQARVPSPARTRSRGRSLAQSRDARSRTRSRAPHYHSPSSPDAQDIRMPDRDGPEAHARLLSPTPARSRGRSLARSRAPHHPSIDSPGVQPVLPAPSPARLRKRASIRDRERKETRRYHSPEDPETPSPDPSRALARRKPPSDDQRRTVKLHRRRQPGHIAMIDPRGRLGTGGLREPMNIDEPESMENTDMAGTSPARLPSGLPKVEDLQYRQADTAMFDTGGDSLMEEREEEIEADIPMSNAPAHLDPPMSSIPAYQGRDRTKQANFEGDMEMFDVSPSSRSEKATELRMSSILPAEPDSPSQQLLNEQAVLAGQRQREDSPGQQLLQEEQAELRMSFISLAEPDSPSQQLWNEQTALTDPQQRENSPGQQLLEEEQANLRVSSILPAEPNSPSQQLLNEQAVLAGQRQREDSPGQQLLQEEQAELRMSFISPAKPNSPSQQLWNEQATLTDPQQREDSPSQQLLQEEQADLRVSSILPAAPREDSPGQQLLEEEQAELRMSFILPAEPDSPSQQLWNEQAALAGPQQSGDLPSQQLWDEEQVYQTRAGTRADTETQQSKQGSAAAITQDEREVSEIPPWQGRRKPLWSPSPRSKERRTSSASSRTAGSSPSPSRQKLERMTSPSRPLATTSKPRGRRRPPKREDTSGSSLHTRTDVRERSVSPSPLRQGFIRTRSPFPPRPPASSSKPQGRRKPPKREDRSRSPSPGWAGSSASPPKKRPANPQHRYSFSTSKPVYTLTDDEEL